MSEYIKISDVIKICKSLYSSYSTTAFFNVPVFENLLRTVAVEFPEPPIETTENENEEPDEIEETYGKIRLLSSVMITVLLKVLLSTV